MSKVEFLFNIWLNFDDVCKRFICFFMEFVKGLIELGFKNFMIGYFVCEFSEEKMVCFEKL